MTGRKKNLKCFSSIKSFPLDYEAKRKAWMTPNNLFERWLNPGERALNKRTLTMNRVSGMRYPARILAG